MMWGIGTRKFFGLIGGAYNKAPEKLNEGVTIMYEDFPVTFAYRIKGHTSFPPIIFATSPKYVGEVLNLSADDMVFKERIVIVPDIHYALEIYPKNELLYLGTWYESPWEFSLKDCTFRLVVGLGMEVYLRRGLLRYEIRQEKKITIKMSSPYVGTIYINDVRLVFSAL